MFVCVFNFLADNFCKQFILLRIYKKKYVCNFAHNNMVI